MRSVGKPDDNIPVLDTGSGKRSNSGTQTGSSNQGRERNVGDALRAVYREAVREDIPDEMLDLLKKLD